MIDFVGNFYLFVGFSYCSCVHCSESCCLFFVGCLCYLDESTTMEQPPQPPPKQKRWKINDLLPSQPSDKNTENIMTNTNT
jgi:hypothetical protein